MALFNFYTQHPNIRRYYPRLRQFHHHVVTPTLASSHDVPSPDQREFAFTTNNKLLLLITITLEQNTASNRKNVSAKSFRFLDVLVTRNIQRR